MRILVTGGTGYLGRAIVHAAAARGHTPVVYARSAASAGLPGETVAGDVRDRASLVAAARGCDAICHTAALVSLWRARPADFDDVNVGGLQHAIDAARAHGIARLVYTSSFLARPPAGRPTPLAANDYQRTKAAALTLARCARDDGAPIVILSPGVVYGPGVETEGNLVGRLLHDHARGRLPGLVGPERIWSFAWIEDVAAAHVVALEQAAPGSEYELGGVNAPVIQAFEIACRLGLGRRLPRRLPYGLAALAGALDELRTRVTGRPPRITRGAVEIFRHDWPLDSTEARRDLRLQVTPLERGIGAAIAPWLGGSA